MKIVTYITEQCGARWEVYSTGLLGNRAFEVVLCLGSKSAAKPYVYGFYASSINAALEALAN